jgi:hypothetical protein
MATQLHNEIIPDHESILAARSSAPHELHVSSSKRAPMKVKKKLIRRTDRDYSQGLRR